MLFLRCCLIYVFVLVLTFILSVIIEFNYNDSLKFGFCLTSSCIGVVYNHFKETIDLYRGLLYMVVPIAGLCAGILGLSNYNLTVKNSIMNNHISNFKLFCEYIDRELKKKDLISDDSIDHYILYSTIFPKSKKGCFDCFSIFNQHIKKINDIIDCSSNHYKTSKDNTSVKKSPFNHTLHQHELKECLEAIGINISLNHRNTFNEVETQVLEFIDLVSKAFVENPEFTKINDRKYI
ncbi:retron Ec48 family effector membrane protein [Photobacterium damselae]|uniref:retron Ec48 family effector membrane protein n=1 Tax=Photobacterium damselae TaxID=38293 RepID=UPI001EE14E90|nr:retron Ec48 family effector membrane protein [Photobacterium damselae]